MMSPQLNLPPFSSNAVSSPPFAQATGGNNIIIIIITFPSFAIATSQEVASQPQTRCGTPFHILPKAPDPINPGKVRSIIVNGSTAEVRADVTAGEERGHESDDAPRNANGQVLDVRSSKDDDEEDDERHPTTQQVGHRRDITD